MDYKFINPDYLNSITGGDSEMIREIVDMFKEQITETYFEMKSFFSDKNYKALGCLAHKAKSSVAIMGMEDLAKLLKTLELQTREGTGSELYEEYIERFKNDTWAAVKELDDLVKNRLKKS